MLVHEAKTTLNNVHDCITMGRVVAMSKEDQIKYKCTVIDILASYFDMKQ